MSEGNVGSLKIVLFIEITYWSEKLPPRSAQSNVVTMTANSDYQWITKIAACAPIRNFFMRRDYRFEESREKQPIHW